MKHTIKNHPLYGECLYIDNGIIELGIPLNFGLRIGHFSFIGENNVFYEQPNDDTIYATKEGWRIRGGHRLWLAPERDQDYYPDNAPITYQFDGETIVLTQQEDPWLKVIKQFSIQLDGNTVKITHKVTNTAMTAINCALWAISVVAPGGTEIIQFQNRDNGMDPWHRISMWDYTNLGDPRVTYTRDQIRICQQPLIEDRYKIGVCHPYGPIRYENNNTVFLKHFQIFPGEVYPDGNVSYETFCSQYMMELESLSPLHQILPGETAEHTEIWELIRNQ